MFVGFFGVLLIMFIDNLCFICGVCCVYFCVFFYWGECCFVGGVVFDELIVCISL